MTSLVDAARIDASVLRNKKQYLEAAETLEAALEGIEIVSSADAARIAKDLSLAGEPNRAHRWATRVADSTDTASWQRASALLLTPDEMPAKRRIRIAVLGTWTTNYLVPMLKLALANRDIAADIHEAGYDQLDTEILDPSSQTRQFKPDLIVLATDTGGLRFNVDGTETNTVVDEELARWRRLWDIAEHQIGSMVLQLGFVARRSTSLGHIAKADPLSQATLIGALNSRMHQTSGSVAIVDCDQLAATIGHDIWFDDRYRYLSKIAVSLDAHPLLAQNMAAVIAAQFGLARKCAILDLDGTLWGGLIGEDGIDGIRLNGTPDGEAHLELQRDLLALKHRGILLAVCSKNEHANAILPFEKHPEMLLQLSDFAAFKANWLSKADNIAEIAAELNLGLDAFVFLDDSPLERREIRSRLPEVDVLAMPTRSEEYPETLRSYLGFETVSITADDLKRNAQYQARSAAKDLQASTGSLNEFYRELHLEAQFDAIHDANLTRASQLVLKTNQFNLTTIRRSANDITTFLDAEANSGFTVRINDRYTDHGLIAVLLTTVRAETLQIDSWVMSCRVIGRTVERSILKMLADHAIASGCIRLEGRFTETPKNALVADLYKSLGFTRVPGADATESLWEIDPYTVKENQFIKSSVAEESGSLIHDS